MTQAIFVNIPVTDITRTRKFYEGIGFSINPMFSSDQALAIVISDTIFVMALTHDYFANFITRPVADPARTTSALICLTREDMAWVDAMTEAALKHGGSKPRPAQDHGFMYSRSFCDPDSNWFEPMWMDTAAAANGPPQTDDAAT